MLISQSAGMRHFMQRTIFGKSLDGRESRKLLYFKVKYDSKKKTK